MRSWSGPFAFLPFRLFIWFCTPTIEMFRSSIVQKGSPGGFLREFVLFPKNFGLFLLSEISYTPSLSTGIPILSFF